MKTPLERLLHEIIAAEGPMRLDRYMALCLGHPEHGYYMTREPFGEAGDFITAPEISQVFGELVGVWLMQVWDGLGRPAPFNLVELGPGRGTLMSDILRAANVLPPFREAARIHLVETSARLRSAQRASLGEAATWHETFDDVPDGPLLLVANEFFDAIPVRQVECRAGRWHERVIGSDDRRLILGLAESDLRLGSLPDGAVLEVDEARRDIASAVGRRLARWGGAALIIDYGHLKSAPGDTLQAMRRHAFVPITDTPGEADLTSHVDFQSLATALRQAGVSVFPALEQGAFLRAMGLANRTDALAGRAEPARAAQLRRAETRLADDDQMGKLFKVLAAVSPATPAPFPFGSP